MRALQSRHDRVRSARAQTALKFFDWAYKNGGQMALELDYIPMPEAVVKLVHDHWKKNLKDASGKAVW